MKKLTGTLTLMLFIIYASAQDRIIKGIIKTADGSPAESVTILIKGTGRGALSDRNGAYQIGFLKPHNYTIAASVSGLKTQSKKVDLTQNQTVTIDFTLEEDSKQLQTVLVTANPSSDFPLNGQLLLNERITICTM